MLKDKLKKLATLPGVKSVQFVIKDPESRNSITIEQGQTESSEELKIHLLETLSRFTQTESIQYTMCECANADVWAINGQNGILLLEVEKEFSTFDIEARLTSLTSS